MTINEKHCFWTFLVKMWPVIDLAIDQEKKKALNGHFMKGERILWKK